VFLSATDITQLTGRKQPRKQIQWLAMNGVKFWVRADGKPAVPADQFTARPAGMDLAALERMA
jgi:hypothetical protein